MNKSPIICESPGARRGAAGRIQWFAVFAALMMLAGCSATFKKKVSFDPGEPLRVAVLPFHQVDDDGNIIDYDPNLFFIDNLPGVSEEITEAPAQVVEKLVGRELARSGLELVPRRFVQAQLVHGDLLEGTKYDHKKILAAPPAELAKLFDADALFYGTITEWDRTYYGLETVSSIAFKLKLVRAADSKVLYEAEVADTDSRGLSKGPTGYTSVVLEPLKGLDNQIILDLAEKLAKTSVSPLLIAKKPEFLESTPPAIFSVAHDPGSASIDGRSPLMVLMFGTGGERASFSLGTAIENVPMVEVDPGHYVGIYYPLPSDRFAEQTLRVSLADELGRVTTVSFGMAPISLNPIQLAR